ncbi:MAG TPA: LPS export ABC transporter periplasmic protein LptC [Terriglobales bacterium]
MPFSVRRLRRWVAAALILICGVVAGVYFYAHKKVQNTLKQVPEKIGLEVQQSANGFTISKSEQGRTLFKLQASKAIQFKLNGKAELHDVAITVYGSDSSRFDQVYGKDFEYDPKSGDVISKSEVQIDLQANPQGSSSSDQTPPKELKNPIHLGTTNLVFNKNTGDAWTPDELQFSVPQASGSAVGAKYTAKEGVLTLQSQVKVAVSGPGQGRIFAEQAVLEKNPREIVLHSARAESLEERGRADELTLFLRQDNSLDHALGVGHVRIESLGNNSHSRKTAAEGPSGPTTVTAEKCEIAMKPENLVKNAVFSGDVHLVNEGAQVAEAWAGRADLSVSGRKVITKIYADERVKLLQHHSLEDMQGGRGRPPLQKQNAQDVEITAPAMDFFVAGGNRLSRAETSGSPQIALLPIDPQAGQTRVTADKFTALFDSSGQLSRVHGEAHAKVVMTSPQQKGIALPDRVSTSDRIDGIFRAGTGAEAMVQEGHFAYSSGTQQAFSEKAKYTPADQLVVLTGSPRVVDAGMETTARDVRLNRASGEGYAEGDVKTTYNDMKPQSGGALLASSDPIHVTAQSMTAQSNPQKAIYKGNARLWQNANVVEAPVIEFQKDQRVVVANSDSPHKVSTTLVGTDKRGKATPVNVTAAHVTYRDSERKAHYEGGVTVRSTDLTITASQMDVFLVAAGSAGTGEGARRSDVNAETGEAPGGPNSPSSAGEAPGASQESAAAKLDKIVASGAVIVTEPNRRATGDQLTYTASDDKFVLTGGPPSIFDAEHGKITGVSLTLFRRDDRVVVEGDSRSPAVTQTRMER